MYLFYGTIFHSIFVLYNTTVMSCKNKTYRNVQEWDNTYKKTTLQKKVKLTVVVCNDLYINVLATFREHLKPCICYISFVGLLRSLVCRNVCGARDGSPRHSNNAWTFSSKHHSTLPLEVKNFIDYLSGEGEMESICPSSHVAYQLCAACFQFQ